MSVIRDSKVELVLIVIGKIGIGYSVKTNPGTVFMNFKNITHLIIIIPYKESCHTI